MWCLKFKSEGILSPLTTVSFFQVEASTISRIKCSPCLLDSPNFVESNLQLFWVILRSVDTCKWVMKWRHSLVTSVLLFFCLREKIWQFLHFCPGKIKEVCGLLTSLIVHSRYTSHVREEMTVFILTNECTWLVNVREDETEMNYST